MNTFVNSISNQEARTANGMRARQGSGKPAVDLFYKFGGSRGKNILPDFTAAYIESPELALRTALWGRDVRGGAGERQLFRDILVDVSGTNPQHACALIDKAVEVGRWDDLLVPFKNKEVVDYAYNKIAKALEAGDGLCAKWMPRKGKVALKLRNFLGMSPKQYRKTLVGLTQVVETAMCSKEWEGINFSHVPSVAAARYRKAFYKNVPEKYGAYVESLKKGDNPKVKVNASAVYPYDVTKDLHTRAHSWNYNTPTLSQTEKDFIVQQWEALPNYVGDASILPIVDVSGSMYSPIGGNGNLTCLDTAVSLGLYVADKNRGSFKDVVLTFSETPKLLQMKGDIVQKYDKLARDRNWGMNTNLHKAFEKILSHAQKNDVSKKDMPEVLLIFSDMQFDQCVRNDDTALKMIKRKYKDAGYKVPKVVFWNLNTHDNVPVKHDKKGTALVSGFSPSIVKAVLAADLKDFTPEAIMLKTVMNDRYAVNI